AYVRAARAAAAQLGLALAEREVGRPGDLPRRLEELRSRADVIWLLPDPTVLQAENVNTLLLASFESRVPLYAFARKYVELGAVAAAHLDPAALGRQAAVLLPGCVDSAPAPGAARWQYAVGAELIVNRKVARKMGLEFDAGLLESADDVLQ
ncbi:MAG TPA: ABC transporter substrate binding protein, partial [Candidatus Methanoperedens sp.]|nr:ABC transporter substrate binding protein [Candidatus Methanoperedens sp.]